MFFRFGPKQPGRKYGPVPDGFGIPRLDAAPMTPAAREAAYRRQTGRKFTLVVPGHLDLTTPEAHARFNGLTARQRRRSRHKSNRLTALAAAANERKGKRA